MKYCDSIIVLAEATKTIAPNYVAEKAMVMLHFGSNTLLAIFACSLLDNNKIDFSMGLSLAIQ